MIQISNHKYNSESIVNLSAELK